MVTDDTHDGSVGESNVVHFDYTFIDDTGETGWGTVVPEEEYRHVEMRLEAVNSPQQYGGYSLGEKVNLRCTVTNLSTTDTITQIALRCGFSDSNYFKDAFKKKYGLTPREYRKK